MYLILCVEMSDVDARVVTNTQTHRQTDTLTKYHNPHCACMPRVNTCTIPCTVMLAESLDGLSLATVHVYSPALVTVRVWVYRAVTGLSNTVSLSPTAGPESLVQVTVVAGPPVEIQVRVFPDNVTPSGAMLRSPRYMVI